MSITIHSAFDSGNILVHEVDGTQAKLSIRKDHDSEFYQWFHFRVACTPGDTLVLNIVDLNGSAYPKGWEGYAACVSEDRQTWNRAPAIFETDVDNGCLSIRYEATSSFVWFAYFAPYSFERHQDLIATAAKHPLVEAKTLGTTLDGRPVDALSLGDGKKQLWVYARQHPGESMAEWFMEGFIECLLDVTNPHARSLRALARIHLVPNMNPDGSVRGHLRTNAAGVNLNREWHAPSLEKSPEVLCVRNAMDETGVDVALDVHGDEAIAGVFLAGFEGIPSLKPEQLEGYQALKAALDAETADFQTAQGYGTSAPGAANLTMSTNQIAERFGAVSMTLEMPFKDHAPLPDVTQGWSPERSKRLAHDFVAVLARHLAK